MKINSKAITKVQIIILIVIIVIAGIIGSLYFFWSDLTSQTETIKIGVLADLDMPSGEGALRGAILAAEQLNVEGGIMGRRVEVFSEDSDSESGADMLVVSNALTKLITVHEADFILGAIAGQAGLVCQDIVLQHKKILMGVWSPDDFLTERVTDDYDSYKYFFRISPINNTIMFKGIPYCTSGLRDITGFNKVGYLAQDVPTWSAIADGLDYVLPEFYGFDLVYRGKFPPLGTIDFASYFAAAEEAGVEILLTLIGGTDGILAVKEWYDRQSPMVLWGINLQAGSPNFWEETDGKCIYTSYVGNAFDAEYPLTSLSLPYLEDYEERWNDKPTGSSDGAYTALRLILPDAIKRAETTETEAVIKALEETSIKTILSNDFRFTSNHDLLITKLWDPETTSSVVFQYQNESELIPIYPPVRREEAGASYIFPEWDGPWNK